MRIAIFTETFIHKNTAAANQAAVLQKGLQQLGHKVLIVTGSTKATEIILDKGMLCCPASKSNNFYRQSANKIYAHMLDYYIGAFKPDVLHILTIFTLSAKEETRITVIIILCLILSLLWKCLTTMKSIRIS